jgi:putative phosphoribosyl transferase
MIEKQSALFAAREAMAFADLSSGGQQLAMKLEPYRQADNLVVLGIAAAGVPAAHEVGKFLKAPVDVVIITKLLAPDGPQSMISAVNVAGTLVLDERLPPIPTEPKTPMDHFLIDAMHRLKSRTQKCRGERPRIELSGKHVLLVDCAIRTGLTVSTAIRATCALEPASIVVAVPVTSQEGRELIEPLADELVYLASPQPFGNAGVWYKDFTRPTDATIRDLLNTSFGNR